MNVFTTGDGLAIVLTRGPNRDVRSYTNPRMVTKADAAPSVTGLWRPVFSILPFEYVLLLTRSD